MVPRTVVLSMARKTRHRLLADGLWSAGIYTSLTNREDSHIGLRFPLQK